MIITHLIYTNVPGSDGSAYRTLSAPRGWTEQETARVHGWLAEVGGRRASATGAGCAAASFRLGKSLVAAVAWVPPGTRHDVHGRPGAVFVHAAFTQVAEGTDAGARVLALPLLEVLGSLTASPEDVQAYLAQCESRLSWSGDPPDPTPVVQGLDRQPLAEFLREAARGSVARTAPEDGVDRAAEWLARATATLPPSLRLSLPWSVGLSKTGTVGPGPAAAVPPGAAERYRLWLEDVLDDGRVDELAFLLHDWEIRSWTQLVKLVDPDPFG